MPAVNPRPDSALHTVPDDADEQALPTQPWHAPPAFANTLGTLDDFTPEFEFEFERGFEDRFELDGGLEGQAGSFDFHDTIPAPPWLDEPGDALEMPIFPAR